LDDATCLFCSEKELASHLIFDCVVASRAWAVIAGVVGFELGESYESVAKL
jgi:hypothetical protein